MKPILYILLLLVSVSCHPDIDRQDNLYGKWILVSGYALPAQPGIKTRLDYLDFRPNGSIWSNTTTCYSFRFGPSTKLLISNGCIDCAVANCNESVWQYQFSSPDELIIEFGPNKGFFRRQR